MAKTIEELAKEIYNECLADGEEVTEEEALEMARMELGAKEIKLYAKSDSPKEPKKRERKVDEEKANILSWIQTGLYAERSIECERENEVKLHFRYNNSNYTVTLTKHKK